MSALTNRLTEKLPADVRLRELKNDLINIGAERRRLEREDVDALRAALTEAGYREVESWIATEGMSWLSSGIQTVSMRIEKEETK